MIPNKTKQKAAPAVPAVFRDLSDTQGYWDLRAEDASIYFNDTFLFFPRKKSWGHITNVGVAPDGATELNVHFGHGISGGHRYLLPEARDDLDFGFPETGIYNFKKGTILLYRKSHRQNKKGLCGGTAGISSTMAVFSKFYSIPVGFLMSQAWRWDVHNLNNVLVRGKLTEFDEAFESVVKLKTMSRALSRNFLVGQGIETKDPSLWFRHSLIGILPAKGKIEILNNSFLQEAADFFLPQGVSIDSR